MRCQQLRERTVGCYEIAAITHFPWHHDDDGNNTMTMMALDKGYQEASRGMIGVNIVDMNTCSLYNDCGRRALKDGSF